MKQNSTNAAENIQKWNVYQRMHGVMGEISSINKDSEVNFGRSRYKYVSHDIVARQVHPLLVKYRLLVIPSVAEHRAEGNRIECIYDVTWINIDDPEQKISVRALGIGNDPSDHGPGKALSYGWKYAILKSLCLATGEDADEDLVPTNREAVVDKTLNKHQRDNLIALANQFNIGAIEAMEAISQALGRTIKSSASILMEENEKAQKALMLLAKEKEAEKTRVAK